MSSINPSLFLLALVVNFIAVRFAGFFLPDQLYFSFSSFLFDTRDLNKPLALAAKLLVPFVVSFSMCFVLLTFQRSSQLLKGRSSALSRLIKEQAPITLAYAAAILSLLMAWPYILLWDVLIEPRLQSYRLVFLIAYIAYVSAVGFFALAGANTAIAFSEQSASGDKITIGTIANNRFAKPIVDIASGAASAALATFFAGQAV